MYAVDMSYRNINNVLDIPNVNQLTNTNIHMQIWICTMSVISAVHLSNNFGNKYLSYQPGSQISEWSDCDNCGNIHLVGIENSEERLAESRKG